MTPRRMSKNRLRRVFDAVAVLASIALIVGLSVEIMTGNHVSFSRWYMNLQLVVCLIFMTASVIFALSGPRSIGRIAIGVLFFLLSVPYLNVMGWCGVDLSAAALRPIGFVPVLRSLLAMFLIVNWLVSGKTQRLMTSYAVTVLLFTYISALIFYDYEMGVNPHLTSFGNALWWAWMNVTTVGAAIFPVTAIGKVVCVLLPALGMMFFPIFTVYVSQLYSSKGGKRG